RLNFAKNDWTEDKFGLVNSKPFDDARRRAWPRRFAQHVCVDQVSQRSTRMESVDSEGKGSNHPFSGQASSKSTKLGSPLAGTFVSRYSPSRRRSKVNCWPASILSCSRNSAGRTIWPFEESVVFINVRYRLTGAESNSVQFLGQVPYRFPANTLTSISK